MMKRIQLGYLSFTLFALLACNACGTVVDCLLSDQMVINTTSVPEGTLGQEYSADINASITISIDSNFDFDWSVNSGSLPEGLELTSDGNTATISGIPTQEGSFSFEIKVQSDRLANFERQDASGCTSSEAFQQYDLEIMPAP